MKNQLDIFRNRQWTAAEWRTAAETARVDPHFTPEMQEQRHAYFLQKAKEAEENSNARP